MRQVTLHYQFGTAHPGASSRAYEIHRDTDAALRELVGGARIQSRFDSLDVLDGIPKVGYQALTRDLSHMRIADVGGQVVVVAMFREDGMRIALPIPREDQIDFRDLGQEITDQARTARASARPLLESAGYDVDRLLRNLGT